MNCKLRPVLIALFLGAPNLAFSQKKNWQNLDLTHDTVFGISSGKCYSELLKHKRAKKVIVAVIDSGIDTAHEDLRAVLWTDPINGHHGRNYVGFESGKEDITCLANCNKSFYDSLSFGKVPAAYQQGYQAYRFLVSEYSRHVRSMEALVSELTEDSLLMDAILLKIRKTSPTLVDFQGFEAVGEKEINLKRLIIANLPGYPDFLTFKKHEMDDMLSMAKYHLSHGLSMRATNEATTALYDSNDVSCGGLGLLEHPNLTPLHGTHVAGIIAAERDNGIGIDGIADNVRIMMLKVLSNIYELRDGNLACAIRYAVDHGATIINFSFGKPYTWDKGTVDEAVSYAMQKDVLIVHAAGNEGRDLDKSPHFPKPVDSSRNGRDDAWIEVGASSYIDDSSLIPSFSNYGKESVDVFAPGVDIYSTVPGSKYASFSGTSMAAPVVTGVAALIREYYPKLTAVQVKDIIMRSVVKREILKDKCVSGGVINAYNAIQLAASYK